MYRLSSANLIGCVGYSITRVSLVHHLVGDWQPDAPFCIVCWRRERASFPPTCSSEAWLASRRAFVQEKTRLIPQQNPRGCCYLSRCDVSHQLWRGGCAGVAVERWRFKPEKEP